MSYKRLKTQSYCTILKRCCLMTFQNLLTETKGQLHNKKYYAVDVREYN